MFFNHRFDQLRLSRQECRKGCIFSGKGSSGSIATAATGGDLGVKRAARHNKGGTGSWR